MSCAQNCITALTYSHEHFPLFLHLTVPLHAALLTPSPLHPITCLTFMSSFLEVAEGVDRNIPPEHVEARVNCIICSSHLFPGLHTNFFSLTFVVIFSILVLLLLSFLYYFYSPSLSFLSPSHPKSCSLSQHGPRLTSPRTHEPHYLFITHYILSILLMQLYFSLFFY